ncbi:MAG: type IV pilus twitching motility protein PilT [Candidatus Nanopelagicales bacterium]
METTPYTGVPAAPAYPAPAGYPAPQQAVPDYPAPAYAAPAPEAALVDAPPPVEAPAAPPATYPGAHAAPEAPAYAPPTGYPAPAAPAAPPVPAAFLPEPEPERVAETVPDPAEAPSVPAAGAVVSHGRATTEQQEREGDFSLVDALTVMLERGASDLHVTTGSKPMIRLSGSLVALEDFPVLTPPVIQRVMYAIVTQAQREKFEEVLELDFAYSLPGRARFRVNMFRQRDSVGAAFRIIPFEIKSLESLGIPPSVANFAGLPRGFVLVTGPTGSGKSTTLAALVDLANRTRHDHIMTVEDPIEFLHKHKSCLINQREVGEDTWSFSNALKHVLRQDPDIILVGEMRDLETISVALTAAETGHLVFATLHTQDAAQTIDRIIDVFPPHQQQQVRSQLAMALQGVVCQTLAKTADGHGRVVATEVLVVTPAVRNLIREGKSHQIYSVMQAGAAHGMHTLDQHLADLVRTRRITYEVGLEKCHHIEDFNRLCGRA